MATKKKAAAASKKSKWPTDDEVKDAVSVINRDYMHDVRGVTREIQRMIREGEITDSESLEEKLNQEIDGHERVIYTHQTKLGLLASDNEDAYEDEIGEPAKDLAAAMYFAMRRDVYQDLEAHGVDITDPTEPGDEKDY